MTAGDIADWQAWERVIGPLGTPRDDIRHAAVAASICNMLRAVNGKTGNISNAKMIPFICPWGEATSKSEDVYYLTDPMDQLTFFCGLAGVPVPNVEEDWKPGGSPLG